MSIHQRQKRLYHLSILGLIISILIGMIGGVLIGLNPFIPLGILVLFGVVYFFFNNFETSVIAILVLRSSLDIFTLFPNGILGQVPAIFTAGIMVLTLLYFVGRLLHRQPIHIDIFGILLGGWVLLQGVWIPLMALGGLGLNSSFLMESVYEWIRYLSWVFIYLLVMQLKGRVLPKRILSTLFLSLVTPILFAILQVIIPTKLPEFLIYKGVEPGAVEVAYRVNGTFGHPNSFAVYLILFIALTFWKIETVENRWQWFILLGFLVFFLVDTKTLITLVMLAVVVMTVILSKLDLLKLISGTSFFAIVVSIFASSDFGQTRLGSIANTPLLNPHIDISRAILLARWDYNSFNWRISQWSYLLGKCQDYPIFGYGLGVSSFVSTNTLMPHNDYVRSLVDGGICGFILHLAFLGGQIIYLMFLLRKSSYCKSQHELCLCLLGVVLATVVGMLTENVMICTAFYMYFWIVLAVAGWDWEDQPAISLLKVTS
ncbi:MAG: O-antigen ligase family protein [Nostocales cyanobacterium 94392]|nr:O-antigen ligase family protein [Nostocales cyanobacterium 94392]